MRARLGRAWTRILDLLFPSGAACLHCGRLSHGELLCPACREGLQNARLTNTCPRCGAPLDADDPCGFCAEGWTLPARSAWVHRGIPAHLIHVLKDGGVADAAAAMAPHLAEAAADLTLPEGTVVTWVPMPDKRRRERGIDHARLLAEQTAVRLHLPCRALLTRVGEQRTQRGLDRESRQTNVRDAFMAAGDMPASVLLIDDVLTTGATVLACADALQRGGAAHVAVLTAVRTVKGGS